jgi:hypothetical protein
VLMRGILLTIAALAVRRSPIIAIFVISNRDRVSFALGVRMITFISQLCHVLYARK